MATARSRPIPLVKQAENPEDEDMRFEFNSNLFEQMQYTRKLAHCKVVVISVAGAFRKGKSFLLNFFLRYLRAVSRGDTRDWIRSQDQLDDGFNWRSGSERDTTGILIWSEPFFICKRDGEKVAVLLMDTQGTFDHQSTQRDCATIFGFSTLLSSVQIFNISQNIQETDLQHLRLFVEFATIAKESKERVLQHLWFLVRDWQNAHEHEYGAVGGQKYLDGVLACDSRKPRENQELRQGIKQHFERASCCLLPHPGKAVADKSFRGEAYKLDPEFLNELERFIPIVAGPESLVVKKVNGTELPGKELFKFFDIYFEAFKNGKMPTPMNIFVATVEMANIAAAQEARQIFEKESFDTQLHEDEFFDIMEVLKIQALQHFRSKCMEPDSQATKETEKKLREDISGLIESKITLRQMQSQNLSADRRNQKLQEEIGKLHHQKLNVVQQMENMELNFKTTEDEIRRQGVSKVEMERLLKELAMKHAVDRTEILERSEDLVKKTNELLEMNAQLKKQLSQSQKEAQRRFEMQLEMRQRELDKLSQRVRELESKDSSGGFLLM